MDYASLTIAVEIIALVTLVVLRLLRRTSWKLVANQGWQLGFTSSQLFLGCQQVGHLRDLSRHAGWQLAAQMGCRKRPALQQVAN